ncbi:MAG: hypothetical protein DRJ45_06390 [Thermoprotei archaeon]|nr:MAG: hypothetical protein DRJ45_06390 [Thermoprotei archaeon]
MLLDTICIGESIIDLIPINGNIYKACFGGSPMNTAIACSKLGLKTGVLTCIGNDLLGEIFIKTFKENNIDILGVKRSKYRTTLSIVIKLPKYGREFYFYRKPWSLSADTELTIDKNDIKYVLSSRMIHLTGFIFSQEPARSNLEKLVNIARENNRVISFDPTVRKDVWPNIDVMKKTLLKVAENSDIILATLDEYRYLYGGREVKDVIKRLCSKNFKMIGIKMGEKGGVLVKDGEIVEMPIFKVDVKDTVGAGDAWNAAVLYGYLNNLDLEDMIRIANATAAIKCMHVGAINGLPTIDEVRKFLKRRKIPEVRKINLFK